MKARAAGMITLFAIAAGSQTKAQSFNCDLARTPDEVLICQDADLLRLDERLAAVYASVRRRLDVKDRRELEFEQASWLQSRKECGRNYHCVEDHYVRRIGQLRGN